jgi:class 3 adenylate cyclase
MERRLTAILAADVVGYSRLMGANETGTLAALKALQADFIDGKIAQHQGRIVKLTGDGMLVEFPAWSTRLPALRKFSAGCAIAMVGCHRNAGLNSVLASILGT